MKDLLIPGSGTIRDNDAWMRSIAEEVHDDYPYQHQLTDEEVQEQEQFFASNSISIAVVEEDKARVMREYNDKIKRMKGQGLAALHLIRTRRREISGTVYEIIDRQERRVGIFDVNGRILQQRPLLGQNISLLGSEKLPYVGDEETEMTSQKTGTND
ncbi:MAG: hypothetical protein ACRC1D_03565 [Culicoidibacterales bacterium]